MKEFKCKFGIYEDYRGFSVEESYLIGVSFLFKGKFDHC